MIITTMTSAGLAASASLFVVGDGLVVDWRRKARSAAAYDMEVGAGDAEAG